MKSFICLNIFGALILSTGFTLILVGSIMLDNDDYSNDSSIAELIIGIICFIIGIIMMSAASKAKRRYNARCHHAHSHTVVHVAYTTPHQQQRGNMYVMQNNGYPPTMQANYNASYPPPAQYAQSPYPMPPAATAPPPYE